MIALAWDNTIMAGRLPFDGGFLSDDGLGTAAFISLFTDRRAEADDGLAGAERRGWVGDVLSDDGADRIGSRLWLLKREKQSEETRARAIEYTAEALAWMIEDELVSGIEIEADWIAPGVLGVRVAFTGGATAAPLVFQIGLAG